MNDGDINLNDYIKYRLEKSKEVYTAACILYDAGQWNSVINRLYYACFYAASSLLLNRDISAKSHSGVIGKFSECIVRTGEMSTDTFKVYSKLLNWRAKGDYSDMFDFTKEDVDTMMQPTKTFIEEVENMINIKE